MNNNRNNNNNNNNRRRGRVNNNRPQNGGPPVNRIDSRARGNAPQMLEKYRKLAQDAHLNGDRVQAEYYLQFADHYFRVIADTRVRQEEARARRDERWQEGDAPERDEGDDGGDFSVESDFPNFDQPVYARRDERPRDDRPGEDRPREDRPREDRPHEDRPREDRPREDRPRNDRPRQERPREDRQGRGDAVATAAGDDDAGDPPAIGPVVNPFLRSAPPTRGLRPRRDGAGRDGADRGADSRPRDAAPAPEPAGLDPALLPPALTTAIGAPRDDAADEATPRRRARRKPAADGAGEALETAT